LDNFSINSYYEKEDNLEHVEAHFTFMYSFVM